MSRLEVALRRLIEGEFVCRHRFPDEFEALCRPGGREKASEVLEAIGNRLCRLDGAADGEGGAFYMAYGNIDPEGRAKVREELRELRQKLHPTVLFLETVRLAQTRGRQLLAGETVFLDEMMTAVRENQGLDQRLAELRELHGARASDDSGGRLERVLVQLEKMGYLAPIASPTKAWVVAGKIDYLYRLLAFMAENMPQITEGEVPDVEAQLPLSESEAGPTQTSATTEGAE